MQKMSCLADLKRAPWASDAKPRDATHVAAHRWKLARCSEFLHILIDKRRCASATLAGSTATQLARGYDRANIRLSHERISRLAQRAHPPATTLGVFVKCRPASMSTLTQWAELILCIIITNKHAGKTIKIMFGLTFIILTNDSVNPNEPSARRNHNQTNLTKALDSNV